LIYRGRKKPIIVLSKESDEALGLANHGVNRRVAGLRVTWTFRRSAHDGVAPKT